MPLKIKLSMNKDIEQQNEQRALGAYNHLADPVTYPDPGSEAASLITIDSAEMRSLFIPSVFSSLTSVMPLYLLQLVGLKDPQDKEKHKRDDSQTLVDEAHIAKRRCMDGTKLIPR